MANATRDGIGGFLARAVDLTMYKRTQGRRARQLTAAGFGLVVLLGCRELMLTMEGGSPWYVQYGLPALIAVAAAWTIYRIVFQSAPFSDFLIATEAEMSKVSWSSKQELKNATIVVLTLMLIMTIYLFLMDRIWETILMYIGVIHVRYDVEASVWWRTVTDLLAVI